MTRDGGAATEERARSVDRVAEQVLAEPTSFSFETAESPAERDAVLRMRYECMVELGWIDAGDYPDGRASDEFDAEATFVVCRDAGELVGSMRLVPPSESRPLPVEREFGIRVGPAGKVFEMGRLVVLRLHRPGRSHRVIAGLSSLAWLEARALGCLRVVSTATAELIELYRGLGLRIVVLGPSQRYWAEDRVPIEIAGLAHD